MRPTVRSGAALLAALLLVVLAVPASGQQTTISYQGVLEDGGAPISTSDARLIFRLWTAETGGTQVGSDCVAYPVIVEDGVFSTQIDFGLTPFEDGAARWLEIGVDATGGTSYTWLSPRTLLTTVPSALYAANAGDSYWTISGSATVTDREVGIGTDTPTSPLEVVLDDSWPAGDIPAIKVNSNYCEADEGYAISATTSCEIGAGVMGTATSPTGQVYGVWGDAAADDGAGVFGRNTSATGTGVWGIAGGADAVGVLGWNSAYSGNAIGVYGRTMSADGFAGFFAGNGYFRDRLGIGTTMPSAKLDVVGRVRADSLTLSAGAADGRVLTSDALGDASWQAPAGGDCLWEEGYSDRIYYTAGNVGIGTEVPYYVLDVVGTSHFTLAQANQVTADHVWAETFRLGDTATDGHILTSDTDGNGTWQPAPETFVLPYSGSVASGSPALSITNTTYLPNSHAIYGAITHASAEAAAGFFTANGTPGCGIKAYADGNDAVYCKQNGATGYALNATSDSAPMTARFANGSASGSVARFQSTGASGGGIEVSTVGSSDPGIDVTTTGTTARGISINTSGNSASGISITTTGPYASGVYIDAQGGDASGVYVTSGGIGITAKGSYAGAAIYGDLDLYEYGTSNKVLELGKGLDYAEGFDVTGGADGAAPGSVLVIDPTSPGHLTLSTRAYDKRVAGIVAGANSLGSGVRLGGDGFDHDVALAGRVYCNAVASDDPIEPGDMLTTSDLPGYAMKADDASRSRGAILGKAMEPLAAGERGQILVLVTLQ